jgi:hypothetical protein
MTSPDTTTSRLLIEDRDLVDAITAFEVDRRRDIASLPATRLTAFMDLAGAKLKDSVVCRLLGMADEGELYQLVTGNYTLSQQQEEVINGLYAIGAEAVKESGRNGRKARAKLFKRTDKLIKDSTDPSSTERSIMEAIADGDLDMVLSMMNYQLGDFNYNA